MKRKTKIIVLWLLTICGFASHSITDMLPMFWGKNVAIATDGVVPGGMVAFMMLLSFFLPACAILCLLADGKGKALKWVNAVLAGFMALFNIAHGFMELPSDNVGVMRSIEAGRTLPVAIKSYIIKKEILNKKRDYPRDVSFLCLWHFSQKKTLPFGDVSFEGARWDSNPRHSEPQSDALTN